MISALLTICLSLDKEKAYRLVRPGSNFHHCLRMQLDLFRTSSSI
jgi:hypothetical protein